jgi:hypothetical protein
MAKELPLNSGMSRLYIIHSQRAINTPGMDLIAGGEKRKKTFRF